MAFGFSPKYVQDIYLDNLTPDQFLVLIVEAAKKQDWNMSFISQTGFMAYTQFSMSSYSEEVTVKINGDGATLKSECVGNQMIDWGKNKRNIEELVESFESLKSTYTPEQLASASNELKATLISTEDDILSKPPPTAKQKFAGFFSIFKPIHGFFVTPILIDLNIGIFILMVLSGVNFMFPENSSMLTWGADFGPLTLNGEWWRMVTNCFLHFGIIHLLLNMYALLYVGMLLEPYLGRARFAAAYLLTGIAASITSLCWHSATISAGASGAIFGMYGVFLAMLTTNIIEPSARKALLTSIGIFVVYNLMNGVKAGIDNAAHIGGLVSGLVIGYTYIFSLKRPEALQLKYITIATLGVLVCASSFIAYKKIPNDLGVYEERIKIFTDAEAKAIGVYNLPETTPKDSLLSAIQINGINNWNKSIQLIKELDKLDLPEGVLARDQKLITYCQLRIKSYNFLFKDIQSGTDKYKDSIKVYDEQIRSVIDSIKAR